jgi:hypothetical protein
MPERGHKAVLMMMMMKISQLSYHGKLSLFEAGEKENLLNFHDVGKMASRDHFMQSLEIALCVEVMHAGLYERTFI